MQSRSLNALATARPTHWWLCPAAQWMSALAAGAAVVPVEEPEEPGVAVQALEVVVGAPWGGGAEPGRVGQALAVAVAVRVVAALELGLVAQALEVVVPVRVVAALELVPVAQALEVVVPVQV